MTKSKQTAAKKTKPIVLAKDAAGKVKSGTAKAKKPDAAGKGKESAATANKDSPAAKKSVHFEKDADFVADDSDEDEGVSDDVGAEDSDFDTDVSKVIFYLCTLSLFCTSRLYCI